MNQNQKSTRDHILKDDDPTYQRQNLRIIKQLQNLLQFNNKNQSPKLGCRELMKKKCLNEGLAQRLVSFNAKLTNFLKMEL